MMILHRTLLPVFFSLVIVATFFWLSLRPAKALSDTFEDLGIVCDIPDGWGASVENGHYYLKNSDDTQLVAIVQEAQDPMPPLDAPGTDIKIAQNSTVGAFTALGHMTLGGVDWIVYDAQQLDPKHQGIRYSRVYYTEANGYGITITTTTLNSLQPQNEPDIMHIINSIAFNGTPQLPGSSNGAQSANAAQNNSTSAPSVQPQGGSALVGFLILAVAGALLVLGIAFIFRLIFRRNKPVKPPPL